MPNLNSRLAKLEAAIAARAQQKQATSYIDLLAQAEERFKDVPTDVLLAEYEAIKTRPIDAKANPELAAELAELEGMDANQLIANYMQKIKGKNHD